MGTHVYSPSFVSSVFTFIIQTIGCFNVQCLLKGDFTSYMCSTTLYYLTSYVTVCRVHNCLSSKVLHDVAIFFFYVMVYCIYFCCFGCYQFEFNIFKVVSFEHINCISNVLLQITQICKCLVFYVDSFILIFSCNVLHCKRTVRNHLKFSAKVE
jgi:hypothetical protein